LRNCAAEGRTAPLQALLFVDDGRVLINSGRDARIFVWRLKPNLGRESTMIILEGNQP